MPERAREATHKRDQPTRRNQGPGGRGRRRLAGLSALAWAQNLTTDAALTGLRWAKPPCRFCGTGCSAMVATNNGRVVATHGDTEAEVNRGLNCGKGYFRSMIMYCVDRLTQPLLRMRDGAYHKDGDFAPIG